MPLAFTFLAPLLLIGVIAGAIPWVLHLLSSVKAQEILFPTLRFLRISMEKTARRRRIQHWLLLIVRTALLTFLALAVAQPISQAVGSWAGKRGDAVAIVLDNSYSMGARYEADASPEAPKEESTRFAKAKAEVSALLSGDNMPALALLTTTNGGEPVGEPTNRLDELRKAVAPINIGYVPSSLAQRVTDAIAKLKRQANPQRVVYVFSDLQRTAFEDLIGLKALKDSPEIHLLIVNTSSRQVNNIGITDLEISGRPIVDSRMEFTVTLTNSTPADRAATVGLRIGGTEAIPRVNKPLSAAGREGSSATVRLYYSFSQPGPVTGEVFLANKDDLEVDNVRRFSLDIGGRVRALVVRGRVESAESGMDPAMMLRFALDPFGDVTSGERPAWPIIPQVVEFEQFKEDDLKGPDIVFFCEVPSFSEAQAEGIAKFVRDGGTAVFFLGPDVQIDNYNDRLVHNTKVESIKAEGGLLPGKLLPAVGEVGPEAPAVALESVDIRHPYFAKLYENQTDYLTVLVQRHFRLTPSVRPGRTLMRLSDGQPLLQAREFGKGQVLLFTSTASPKWGNFAGQGAKILVPAMIRAALYARQGLERGQMYLAGAQVTIRPPASAGEVVRDPRKIDVTLPPDEADGRVQTAFVPLEFSKAEGYFATFRDTARLGLYRWQLATGGVEAGPGGTFVVNPNGAESKMESFSPDAFRQAMKQRGIERVYVGGSLAEVQEAARGDAKDRPWLDHVVAVVVLLLVFEAIIANRRKLTEDAVPAYLNPKTAG